MLAASNTWRRMLIFVFILINLGKMSHENSASASVPFFPLSLSGKKEYWLGRRWGAEEER